MKISNAACYGIVACTQLSHDRDKRPISSTQLAVIGDMPERFLLQVMRDLVQAGICESTRGVEGGYRLAREKHKISLAQIVEAIDGPFKGDDRESIAGLSGPSNRMVKEAMDASAKYLRSRLEAISLNSMRIEQAKQLAATA